MSSLTRNASVWVARASLAFVVLSFALYGTWSVGVLFGQSPPPKKQRVEEEEETPKAKNPKRKDIRVEEEEPPKAKPKEEANRSAEPAASSFLADLAKQATHPAVKALFDSLAVPHDVVSYQRSSVTSNGERIRQEDNIEPTPFYLGNDPGRYRRDRFKFTRFTKDWQRGKSFEPLMETLDSVRPYEEVAQDKVNRFLRETYDQREQSDPLYLSRYDMLTAADQALSFVRRWHESAISTGKRRGEGWDKVGQTLSEQLLDKVLMVQLKLLAQAKEWNRVLELTHRLAKSYSNDARRERILQPAADMIKQALNDPIAGEEDKKRTRERLHELEMEFPDNPVFRPLSNTLRDQAQSRLERAKELHKAKNDKGAGEILLEAKQIWPQLPGLREFEIELGMEHPILRIGVRGPLPKYFSPAQACTDNERRIVEMLFESLIESVPDGAGGFHYRRELAESSPKVVQLGRKFRLPHKAVWSDGRALNSTDIKSSLNLYQAGMGVGLSRVWGDMLVGAESMKDPFQVTLRMRQGFLDALAPMTFKILPRDKPVYGEEFAKNPVTSGPFRLDVSQRSDETRRECLVFVANPSYGLRPSKRGAPRIQEVRFYSYTSNTNIASDLGSGKLDLVLDLTAKEAETLLSNRNATIVVPMPSRTVPNRRIYFLAINTRKLTSSTLRQALSFAIDRETLLNKHFRDPLNAPLHKVLNGPFPAGSWACNDKQVLYNRDGAKLLKQQQAVIGAAKAGPLDLKYESDNPALDEAMKELCSQVKELTGVEIHPNPCDPYKLREDVEQTKNYDLAYYHYDFPDEIYWLAPLFGPPPGRDDDSNIFKYQNAELTNLLARMKSFRNFATIQKHQQLIHDLLNREMPFIPLWQLDPLLAYSRDVEPAALDPLLIFGNIEEWRLNRK